MSVGVMRKLGCFVALSLVAHLWIIYGMPFEMPRSEEPALLVLEARLQPAPPLPPVLPRAQPTPAALPASDPVIYAPLPGAVQVPDAAPQAQAEPAAPAANAEPAAPPPAVAENKPAAAPAPPLARRLPRKGQILYELYLGNDRLNVGRTQQSWEITGERYRLASVSETTGFAAIFSRQRLAYESNGRLTASGLKPERFTTERMRGGKTEKAAADFDWAAAAATVGDPPRSVALPADAQDIVSFMYQLGLAPLTPGRIVLPVTNGWKLERYDLEIGGEEQLQTPFGLLRAVPVKQIRRQDQESIELWLAPAYRWLPVRIRFYNREGEPSGEQLVSEIRVSDD
jgi:hypothetical protein